MNSLDIGLAALDIAEAMPRWGQMGKMSIKQGFVLRKIDSFLAQPESSTATLFTG